MTEKLAQVPGAPIYIAFKVSKIKPCTIHKQKKKCRLLSIEEVDTITGSRRIQCYRSRQVREHPNFSPKIFCNSCMLVLKNSSMKGQNHQHPNFKTKQLELNCNHSFQCQRPSRILRIQIVTGFF